MLAAEVPDTARTRHFHLDHLGTPRLITGNGGAELSRHNYHPFGVEIASPSASSTAAPREKKQFTGHERDAESLDYMHARFYAPYMARFLSVDPAGYDPARPQSWNRYSYVLNNPINMTDPTGRCGEAANFIGPRVPCQVTLKPPQNAANWTPAQRAAENAKNAQRAKLAEEGKLVVTRGQSRPSSTQLVALNGGPHQRARTWTIRRSLFSGEHHSLNRISRRSMPR